MSRTNGERFSSLTSPFCRRMKTLRSLPQNSILLSRQRHSFLRPHIQLRPHSFNVSGGPSVADTWTGMASKSKDTIPHSVDATLDKQIQLGKNAQPGVSFRNGPVEKMDVDDLVDDNKRNGTSNSKRKSRSSLTHTGTYKDASDSLDEDDEPLVGSTTSLVESISCQSEQTSTEILDKDERDVLRLRRYTYQKSEDQWGITFCAEKATKDQCSFTWRIRGFG